jgi:hypothetical protein
MSEAAEKLEMNIQCCMGLSCHILHALQVPRVTHARVSGDYAGHLEIRKQKQTFSRFFFFFQKKKNFLQKKTIKL